MKTFAELCLLEPRLLELEHQIKTIKDNPAMDYFCANDHWYRQGGPRAQVTYLAGWHARKPELQTMEAYDVAYQHLYDLLPGCRNCSCLYMDDLLLA